MLFCFKGYRSDYKATTKLMARLKKRESIGRNTGQIIFQREDGTTHFSDILTNHIIT